MTQFNVSPNRWPQPTDFADLTNSKVNGPIVWSDDGNSIVIPFDVEPTATEQAAIARRLRASNANEETIFAQATSAQVANRTYLAIASPTNAQNAAQIKALTRQVNGLIRLALRDLGGTD